MPKPDFKKGDTVAVTDGPFKDYRGIVDELFPEKGIVRVLFEIFERLTPLELKFDEVTKVDPA